MASGTAPTVFPMGSSPNRAPIRAFDLETPRATVPVQGRIDGPVERYRVASPQACRAAKVLGWTAVLVGAGEMAIGIVIFNKWLREGGWWAGILGSILGVVATGITADTPVGTRLVSWLVWLGLATAVVSLVTLVVLDGATWLDTKDLEACAPSFDDVCPPSDCTCTTSDDRWDKCFDFDDCDDLDDTAPALLASGIALIILIVVSSLLFCLGIQCKYLGGGRETGGEQARIDPAKTPGRRASYAENNGGSEDQKEARTPAVRRYRP